MILYIRTHTYTNIIRLKPQTISLDKHNRFSYYTQRCTATLLYYTVYKNGYAENVRTKHSNVKYRTEQFYREKGDVPFQWYEQNVFSLSLGNWFVPFVRCDQ